MSRETNPASPPATSSPSRGASRKGPSAQEPASRRDFLRRLAGSAVVAPLFVTVGARAFEQSAFEKANQYLGQARDLVARARQVAGEERKSLATEALTELTEAKATAKNASQAEQEKLQKPIASVSKQVDDLLSDG